MAASKQEQRKYPPCENGLSACSCCSFCCSCLPLSLPIFHACRCRLPSSYFTSVAVGLKVLQRRRVASRRESSGGLRRRGEVVLQRLHLVACRRAATTQQCVHPLAAACASTCSSVCIHLQQRVYPLRQLVRRWAAICRVRRGLCAVGQPSSGLIGIGERGQSVSTQKRRAGLHCITLGYKGGSKYHIASHNQPPKS